MKNSGSAMRRGGSATTIALILSGCTNLTSVHDKPLDLPVAGISYSLPELNQQVTVTWRLAKCGDLVNGQRRVEFEVEATQAGAIVPGPSYVIDPEKLVTFNKTGTFKVAYHKDKNEKVTPYLKSINVEVEDRSPQIISGLVGFGFNVARMAMGVPSLAGGAIAGAKISSCSDDARLALEARTGLTGDLAKIKAEAKRLTEEAQSLAAIAAARALNQASRQRIAEIARRSVELTETLAVTNKKIAKLDKILAIQVVLSLPSYQPNGEATASPDTAEFTQWIQQIFGESIPTATRDKELSRFAATASLKPVNGGNAPKPLSIEDQTTVLADGRPRTKPASHAGVLYRSPAPGKLLACAKSVDPAADQGACKSGETELIKETIAVPQFGRYRALTLKNDFGERAGIEAVFAIDGSLESFGYGKTVSGAEALAKMLESTSAAGVAFAGQVREKNAKPTTLAAVQASNELKKAQLEALDYDAKLAAALNPKPPTTETAKAAAGVAVLNLQLSIQDTIDLAAAGS